MSKVLHETQGKLLAGNPLIKFKKQVACSQETITQNAHSSSKREKVE